MAPLCEINSSINLKILIYNLINLKVIYFKSKRSNECFYKFYTQRIDNII